MKRLPNRFDLFIDENGYKYHITTKNVNGSFLIAGLVEIIEDIGINFDYFDDATLPVIIPNYNFYISVLNEEEEEIVGNILFDKSLSLEIYYNLLAINKTVDYYSDINCNSSVDECLSDPTPFPKQNEGDNNI